MIGTLVIIGLVFVGVWVWQFVKIIDGPANPETERNFWKTLYFTEYWHGPDDTL